MGGSRTLPSPIALIMAGGSGTRFWPLSQKKLPKQYLKLSSDKSLIQLTVDRIRSLCKVQDIYISSGGNQKPLLHEHLPDISNLILEPASKNTAACLMLSVATLLRKGYSPETPMMVFPADHEIGNQEQFLNLMNQALEFACSRESLVTLGIVPSAAHTGYGYIEAASSPVQSLVFPVKRFTEKPDRATAESFLKKGSYFWNSGIFVWTLGAISNAFETFLSQSWNQILEAKSEDQLSRIFSSLPSLPIDTAIMEKASNVFVIPAGDLNWSDLGSWSALFDLKANSSTQNVCLSGQIEQIDAEGCLIQVSPETKVALIGTRNLIVIEHNGILLIAEKSQDQKVKDISQLFEA